MSYFDISYSYLCKNKEIMAKDLFNRYIWLVDTIYQAHGITFEEINEKWLRNSMSEGLDIPLKTFHNHRKAIEEIFDINIVCDKRGGYKYYIENADDMEKGGIRTWLLNTFAVNNLINPVRADTVGTEIPYPTDRSNARWQDRRAALQKLLAAGRIFRGSGAVPRQSVQATLVSAGKESPQRCIEDIRLGQNPRAKADRKHIHTPQGFQPRRLFLQFFRDNLA